MVKIAMKSRDEIRKVNLDLSDIDGCLYHALSAWDDPIVQRIFEAIEKKQNIPLEWFVPTNLTVFDGIVARAKDGQYDLVVTGSFTNRQSKHVDSTNGCLSSIYAFLVMQNYLAARFKEEGIGCDVVFDPALMADIYDPTNPEAGKNFERLLTYHFNENEQVKKEAKQQSAPYFFDKHKFMLIIFWMHRISSFFPTAEIDIDIRDDKKGILESLQQALKSYPIPKKIKVRLHQYDGVTNREYACIKGKYDYVDEQYDATVRYLTYREYVTTKNTPARAKTLSEALTPEACNAFYVEGIDDRMIATSEYLHTKKYLQDSAAMKANKAMLPSYPNVTKKPNFTTAAELHEKKLIPAYLLTDKSNALQDDIVLDNAAVVCTGAGAKWSKVVEDGINASSKAALQQDMDHLVDVHAQPKPRSNRYVKKTMKDLLALIGGFTPNPEGENYEQFIKDFKTAIYDIDWKTGLLLGGTIIEVQAHFNKNLFLPKAVPNNVAQMLRKIEQHCKKSNTSPKDWMRAYSEISNIAGRAQHKKGFSLFSIGERDKETQDFYDALANKAYNGNRLVPAINPTLVEEEKIKNTR